MKKIIFLVAVFSAILNAGIVSKGVSKNGAKYNIWDEGGQVYSVSMKGTDYDKVRTYSKVSDYKRNLFTQLNIAARETKKMGYKYFVVVNTKINNLNGFPLNNANNLLKFVTLKTRKPSFATNGSGKRTTLVRSGEMILHFKPVPSSMLKNGLISIWSVKQTLRDTKQYK